MRKGERGGREKGKGEGGRKEGRKEGGRKGERANGRKGRGNAAPTPPPFPFFPVLRSYFRVSFTYASFLLSERLEPESGFIQCIILFNET